MKIYFKKALNSNRLSTNKCLHRLQIAAAGLKLGDLGIIIINQPLAWQPVKLVSGINIKNSEI